MAIFDQEDLLDSDTLYLSLYSGVFIYQALSKVMPHAKISWSMVTSHVHSVIGDEEINPLKSTVLSLCRVLPLENSNFHMNHIDVDLIADIDALIYYSDVIIDRTMKGLFNEKMNDNAQIVALRHNKCWVPFYHQVKFTDHTASQSIMPIDHGVYLITGGLGGMGLTLTQWLCAKNTNITVVLLSRTDFPEQISWNEWVASHNPENSISNKIKLLQQIISTGCRVEIFQVDIAHFQKMKKIISIVENQIGAIRGIFHLAGIPGKGLAALKSIDGIRTVLRPKLQGTYVLVKLFRKKELDFFIAASSLTAIVGGVGQIDYCAANIFLDNFLRKNLLKNCRRLLTINWNAWRSVGMATNVGHVHCRLYAGNSVTPEQGVAVLQQLFSAPYTQIVVTRYSPEEEIMRIKETFRYSQPERNQLIDEKIKSLGIYDVVKHAWEKVLGVTEVSKEVTFYDYGGDSLTLVQLIIILEQYIGIKIMLRDLMQHLTLDAMTSFVKQSLVKTG